LKLSSSVYNFVHILIVDAKKINSFLTNRYKPGEEKPHPNFNGVVVHAVLSLTK